MRALAFAAAPILLIALCAGVFLRMDRLELVGLVFNPFLLSSVFVVNIIALVYRVVAIIDAYRVAEWMNTVQASGDGRLGRREPAARDRCRSPGSRPSSWSWPAPTSSSPATTCSPSTRSTAAASSSARTSRPSASRTPPSRPTRQRRTSRPTPRPPARPTARSRSIGSAVPEVSIPPWDGQERLNILLIGADKQGGGHRTDTLITVSIDPVTKKVAMFSLPRDTVDLPVPAGPARSLWGRSFRQKINSFYVQNYRRADIWPGKQSVRGYNALKSMMGELYGLDIKYFVEVDFDGFKDVVDAIGGVTVNVQTPVVDDTYPVGAGRNMRLYIPSGLQHMNGSQALRYARSRNTSSDFDRGARQQRILLSMREQADPAVLLPRLPDLVEALKGSVKTDIPLDQIPKLLGLATEIDTTNIRSYVFSPPTYSQDTCHDSRGCVVLPKIAAIRSSVDERLQGRPGAGGASRGPGRGGRQGVGRQRPERPRRRHTPGRATWSTRAWRRQPREPKPEGAVPADTKIVVYNGAEGDLAQTIAYLEQRFKVEVELANDPAMRADVVITVGRETPDLRPPPSS